MAAEQNDRDVTLERLQLELLDIFCGNEADMNQWLDFNIPALDGERPRDMFDTPARRQRLYLVLQAMKFGETA